VYLQAVHLKNRVSDSSALLVCCNHQKASLFPHLGQIALVVGNVFISSPVKITVSWEETITP